MHQSVLLKNWVSPPIGLAIGELTCGYAPGNTMLIRIRQSFGYPCLTSLLQLPFQDLHLCYLIVPYSCDGWNAALKKYVQCNPKRNLLNKDQSIIFFGFPFWDSQADTEIQIHHARRCFFKFTKKNHSRGLLQQVLRWRHVDWCASVFP